METPYFPGQYHREDQRTGEKVRAEKLPAPDYSANRDSFYHAGDLRGDRAYLRQLYMRKTESLHGTDVYYKVYTKIVENYMKQHNIEEDKDLPEYFVTAMTLDYRQRSTCRLHGRNILTPPSVPQ